MTRDRGKLETCLGYSFKNPDLLDQALTHRSAGRIHNERLEFLGDAILDMVIAERLFARYPRATEGELSRMRANLVNGDVLAEIAVELELGRFLKLGAGERKSGGKRRVSILANAVEAIIAAIYLESGLTSAAVVVDILFHKRVSAGEIRQPLKDSKTRLQELMQADGWPLPSYTVADVSGDPHNQIFTVECQVEPLQQSENGSGKSKRMAEQDAAEKVLAVLEKRT